MSVRYAFKAPTLGSMAMQLSFNTISRLVSAVPAWFMPSKASPAVMAPSPMTAIWCRSRLPCSTEDAAMPKAAEIDVDEWPTPKASKSLSARLGNPARPPYSRLVEKLSRRPVRIL